MPPAFLRMEQKVFFALAKDPSPASKKRKQESDTVFTTIKWSKTYPEWMPIQVLPAEMLCRVFEYLPLKDKCCMSLVCSYWKSLIDETLALMTSLDLSSEVCSQILHIPPPPPLSKFNRHGQRQQETFSKDTQPLTQCLF